MAYLPFKSHYRTHPTINVQNYNDQAFASYQTLITKLANSNAKIITIECYHGVDYAELEEHLIKALQPALTICSDEAAFSADEIKSAMHHHITDDRVFGVMSHHKLADFFHAHKIKACQEKITNATGLVVVYGVGASLISHVSKDNILLYADVSRWEIQLRYRAKKVANWRDNNFDEDILRRYKRGYFMEWRWADQLKKELWPSIDYYLDTNLAQEPKILTGKALRESLKQVYQQPFRLKPYFDPGVWGGQWMKEVCNLPPDKPNYAWSFDGVPEENSLLLQYGKLTVEMPATNLVFAYPKELLGHRVFARFGAEFPIRFDFLDTMQGGHLSLQVHPTTDYAYNNFGIKYTQDESYYILAAEKDAHVYLGLKENVDQEQMIGDLKRAEKGEISFDAKKYINTFACKAHDHFLIPAGTLHCSGANSMVLEISATPYIFTFKMWDWDRLGLDGKPRPVHIDHGNKVIDWTRTTPWVEKNLVNAVSTLHNDDKLTIEQTGLHEFEFIDTLRYTLHQPNGSTIIKTDDSVHMLNLVEGQSIRVESPTNEFEAIDIYYAETFIVPASCREYRLVNSSQTPVKIMQANVRR